MQVYSLFISIINNKDNSILIRIYQLLFSRARPFLNIVLFISCIFGYMYQYVKVMLKWYYY